ncbi:cytosolic Fe-S cluster assembly factor NUBP2 homolog [Oculina patagonica]
MILIRFGKGRVGKSAIDRKISWRTCNMILGEKMAGILDVDLCWPSVEKVHISPVFFWSTQSRIK